MKILVWLILVVVTLAASMAQAQYFKVSNEIVPFYFSIEGMPAFYHSMTSVSALGDSLKSPMPRTRIFATYRLAEMRVRTSFNLLKEAYEAEPINKQRYIDSQKGMKYYALVAMGILGGQEAEQYLCHFAEECFFSPKGFSWAGDDAIDIAVGILDGLSVTRTACAESLVSRIIAGYEKEGRPNATLQIAYTARYRLLLLSDEAQTRKSQLLNELKLLTNSVQQTEDQASSKEYYKDPIYQIERTKRDALRINVLEIGIANPDALREYKMTLPANDSFVGKLDYLINLANNWRSRLDK